MVTDPYGIEARHTDLATDCLIKLAAIETCPGVNPKHQVDLDVPGFDISEASEAHLAFYEAWQTILQDRYL